MEKSEVLETIANIGTCEDDVKRRELLATLSEGVSDDYDNLAKLSEDIEVRDKRIEELQESNMKLFLRVSEQKSNVEVQKATTGIENKEKRDFNNLFDEKGGIK